MLHPGRVTGTVGLTGTTVQGGSVSVGGNASGFSGSTSFSGDTFSVTVEGDQTYQYISVYEYLGTGYFNLSRSAPYFVPADGSVSVDLRRPGGKIVVHVTVTGGTVASASMSANGWTTNESYYASNAASGGNDVALPMAAVPNVSVSGSINVSVVDSEGGFLCNAQRPAPTQTVDVIEGQISELVATVAVTPADCLTEITGTVALRNMTDGTGPTTSWVYASGPAYASTSVNGNEQTYLLSGLSPGTYWTGVSQYFGAPYHSGLYAQSRYVTLQQGESRVNDWIFDGVPGTGQLSVTGAWKGRPIYGNVNFQGPSAQEAFSAYANVASDGAFRVVLATGLWYLRGISLSFWDSVQAINSYTSEWDWGASGQQAATGAPVAFGTREVTTSAGQIVFDVIEPPGSPVIGISNPAIYANRYDSTTGRYVYVQAYSYVTGADTPAVQIVGSPGIYQFDAWGTVAGSWTRFASSTLELGESVNTPTGTNVTIVPKDSTGQATPVTLEFANVTGGGTTTATITDVGPAGPADYIMLKAFGDNQYIDISTTSQFAGKIELCLQYDPIALGLTQKQEERLVLQHYVCTASNCTWENINEVYNPHVPPFTDADPTYFGRTGGPAVNTETNVICGVTSSLSPFALTLPEIIEQPPTNTCIGTADAFAQIETDAGVCTATVDNINKRAGGCEPTGDTSLLSCTFDGAASAQLSLGDHAVSVVGTAADTSASTCTSYVNVVDREAPQITCPAPVQLECSGPQTPYTAVANAIDNCATASAACGADSFVLGTSELACHASDAADNRASCSTSVAVLDTTPPALSVAASPARLYPPNHKMIPITLKTPAADVCDANPSVTCTAESNEPVTGGGTGNTSYDILWKDGQLLLRSERAGTLSSRIYTIRCTAIDSSGNRTTATTEVVVPHDGG